jgi:hypothetical protein
MFRNVLGKNTSTLLNLFTTKSLHSSPAPHSMQESVETAAYNIASTYAKLHATYFHIRSLVKPLAEVKATPSIFCEGAYANMLKTKAQQEARADQLEKELKALQDAHPRYRYR